MFIEFLRFCELSGVPHTMNPTMAGEHLLGGMSFTNPEMDLSSTAM